MTRPVGETKRERTLQRILGAGIVFVFFLLCTIVIQGDVLYRSQNNHHAASAILQSEIIAKDRQIVTLLKQHSVTFAQQKVAAAKQTQYDADVKILAEEIEGQLTALCANHVPACPKLPPLP